MTVVYIIKETRGITNKLVNKKCVENREKYRSTNGAVPTCAAIETLIKPHR